VSRPFGRIRRGGVAVEIIYPRVAGIDVGKREIAVAVRVPGEIPGERRQRIGKFKTFYQVLRQMVAWLVEQGVTHVAMEATGVYWKPVVRHEALVRREALGTEGGARPSRWVVAAAW
jgi:hypothetical protein